MILSLKSFIQTRLNGLCRNVKQRLRRWTKPDSQSLALNAVLDLSRSKSELVLENALLRQRLIVLQRQVKRPALTRASTSVSPAPQRVQHNRGTIIAHAVLSGLHHDYRRRTSSERSLARAA